MPTEEQTYRQNVLEKLDNIQRQVSYTNGKVRKITIALVLLGGIVLGESFTPHDIISLLASHFL